jgi:hypothetical protein
MHSAFPPRFRADRRAARMAQELASGGERALLRALVRGAHHERPVFVVGVPRSGTTSMVVLLRASRELDSSAGESHAVWLLYHHPRFARWASAAVGPDAVRLGERRWVNAYFASQSAGAPRLLDKTPANSLRIPHILELFPDATVVVMRRNPLDGINSLIKGWRHPQSQYGTFVVPEDLRIPDYPWQRLWCFALPPGWRSVIGRPLAEVCFHQWDAIAASIEDARAAAPASSRWVDVRLEDLLDRPDDTLEALCAGIGIPVDDAMRETLRNVRENPVNALSAPAPGKWRAENGDALTALLPRIAAASVGRGYAVDERTGDFTLEPR